MVDKKRLSERLKEAGLNKEGSSEKDASIELLSTFFLSTTQKQEQAIPAEKAGSQAHNKFQTKRIAQRAVKMLGEAIGKR